MKIKYQMPLARHPSHKVVNYMTIKQLSVIIKFLEFYEVDFEYVHHSGKDSRWKEDM